MNLLSFLVNSSVTFGDVMFWIYALVMFIIVLGVIILLHEGGHFFFAKKAGILCHEFSIGMGPVVKSIKKGETSYSIRAIPIGGFVSMAGEDTNETMLQKGQKISVNFKTVKHSELLLNPQGLELEDEEIKVISEISVTDKVEKEYNLPFDRKKPPLILEGEFALLNWEIKNGYQCFRKRDFGIQRKKNRSACPHRHRRRTGDRYFKFAQKHGTRYP